MREKPERLCGTLSEEVRERQDRYWKGHEPRLGKPGLAAGLITLRWATNFQVSHEQTQLARELRSERN